VIAPVLPARAATRRIADTDCLRCGRCIDVCGERVFEMRWRPLAAARAQPPAR